MPDLTSVGAIDIKRKAAIRARLDAATPGPWRQCADTPWGSKVILNESGEFYLGVNAFTSQPTDGWSPEARQRTIDLGQSKCADAALIAHAREDVEALLNDVEFLEAEAKRAWEQVGKQADVKAKALRAIDAVVALHRGVEEYVTYSSSEHDECDDCQSGPGHRETVCSECRDQGSDEYWTYVPWPCPTVKALTEVMDPKPSLAVVGGSDA